MSNHRAYQTNPVISNILMRKTCSKTNKPARLTTIKQHFASHDIKHGSLKSISLLVHPNRPPRSSQLPHYPPATPSHRHIPVHTRDTLSGAGRPNE